MGADGLYVAVVQGDERRSFVIGNGGTDVLRLIGQSFLFEGGEGISSRVTFPLFRLLATMYGGRPIVVEPVADYGLDLSAMAEVVTDRSRVVWLCSPNNPTGLGLGHAQVEAFLDRLPEHVVVVIDESYIDFVDDPAAVDSLAFVRAGRPVIAVRSFSKSAGLANLRVGYGVSRPDVIEYLLHAVLPFNTGSPVAQAAIDWVLFDRNTGAPARLDAIPQGSRAGRDHSRTRGA